MYEDELEDAPVKGRPVNEKIKASTASCNARRERRNCRAKINDRPAVDRAERASAIFLRLAVLAATAPGKLLHHRQMHESRQVTGATVWAASHDVYGLNPSGVEHAHTALAVLSYVAGGDPETTGHPSIPFSRIKAAYRYAKALEREAKMQRAEEKFRDAVKSARVAVSGFFASVCSFRA